MDDREAMPETGIRRCSHYKTNSPFLMASFRVLYTCEKSIHAMDDCQSDLAQDRHCRMRNDFVGFHAFETAHFQDDYGDTAVHLFDHPIFRHQDIQSSLDPSLGTPLASRVRGHYRTEYRSRSRRRSRRRHRSPILSRTRSRFQSRRVTLVELILLQSRFLTLLL